MNVKKKGLCISMVAIAAVVAMLGGLTAGFNTSMDKLEIAMEKTTSDAVLASSNIKDETLVNVPIMYYDQKLDECVNVYDGALLSALNSRQFGWSECGYYSGEIETGLVDGMLSNTVTPVALDGGKLATNRGVKAESFDRWFKTVDGASRNYAGALGLTYKAAEQSFTYDSTAFYPLDELVAFDGLSDDGHNHLFTLSLGVPVSVVADGSEAFEITADDDTWVYVGDKLVIDMGGVHAASTGKLEIRENGEIYTGVNMDALAYAGAKLTPGGAGVIRVFHADRDGAESVFKLKFDHMVLNIADTEVAAASTSGDAVEIAFDPNDPYYVAPLGASLIHKVDNTEALKFTVTVEVVAMGVLAFALVYMISRMVKKNL